MELDLALRLLGVEALSEHLGGPETAELIRRRLAAFPRDGRPRPNRMRALVLRHLVCNRMVLVDNMAEGHRMKLDGTIDIAAPPAEVWAVVIDPTDLAACVPGVREVRQVDPQTFTGTVRASIGPLDGDFVFESVLTVMNPLSDLVVDVEGQDSVTKSRVVTHLEVTLSEPSPGHTTLDYRANVSVKGRLAIVGEMVLRATAGMMIGQVSRCLRNRLEPVDR